MSRLNRLSALDEYAQTVASSSSSSSSSDEHVASPSSSASQPPASISAAPVSAAATRAAALLAALDSADVAAHAAHEPRRFARAPDDDDGVIGAPRAPQSAPRADLDAMYDEFADEADEAWRREQQESNARVTLACPGCFTAVAFGARCVAPAQFEARRVRRCKLSRTHVVRAVQSGSNERLAPVLCEECDVELGLFSARDNLYHLFHVIDSN